VARHSLDESRERLEDRVWLDVWIHLFCYFAHL
jgi:hypothetical protein